MIGILVELLLSWLILWMFDKSNLSVLGFKITTNQSLNFIFGFLGASLFCVLYYFSYSVYAANSITVNKQFTFIQFLHSFWWVLSSVLFEELIFRGALLYILIKKFGIKYACIASAIAFGIYHWFSFGVIGNPASMLVVFIMTGIWGLMYAFAYAKTKSLYLPIGLHLGWNLIHIAVFSKGPLGHQFLIVSDKKLEGIESLIFFILQIIVLPVVTYLCLKKNKQNPDKLKQIQNSSIN
ncbi:CPBP family intramembrane glutamic endopeptidase [Flavobacterium sp. LC2016-01]|uniref:CPBP family intramembrane glutamic endopeptidase n=1 Tax=Flavobacterium sp. LC2016-01 TaxID=2675876 RepID=UPI0012BB194B|nr:CPBP family intramembrane glutamic endopeptidase [Flavobacterium sp. LC2016-01]MTH15484.1 CPBP family intramembrane metalloprotease [Flavobacterium sp. LC2016-01]